MNFLNFEISQLNKEIFLMNAELKATLQAVLTEDQIQALEDEGVEDSYDIVSYLTPEELSGMLGCGMSRAGKVFTVVMQGVVVLQRRDNFRLQLTDLNFSADEISALEDVEVGSLGDLLQLDSGELKDVLGCKILRAKKLRRAVAGTRVDGKPVVPDPQPAASSVVRQSIVSTSLDVLKAAYPSSILCKVDINDGLTINGLAIENTSNIAFGNVTIDIGLVTGIDRRMTLKQGVGTYTIQSGETLNFSSIHAGEVPNDVLGSSDEWLVEIYVRDPEEKVLISKNSLQISSQAERPGPSSSSRKVISTGSSVIVRR
jgi:hypothetical protein